MLCSLLYQLYLHKITDYRYSTKLYKKHILHILPYLPINRCINILELYSNDKSTSVYTYQLLKHNVRFSYATTPAEGIVYDVIITTDHFYRLELTHRDTLILTIQPSMYYSMVTVHTTKLNTVFTSYIKKFIPAMYLTIF
jgi:hypothetical protein